MDKTSLGDRMKGYEAVSQNILLKRTPVIIRVDGKAFHTFTKGIETNEDSPFSDIMADCMGAAAAYLTHHCQCAVLSYTQSDEISVLFRDWDQFHTQQWFGGKVQKMVSVSAAMATTAFYARYEHLVGTIEYTPHRPLFDSRIFNVPHSEVVNYFVWRQKDAMRNSVNMFGQHHFSHKELQGKNIDEVKHMLLVKGIDWSDLPVYQQRGFCINKTAPYSSQAPQPDLNIPVFTEDRNYIERWLDGDFNGES